MDDLPPLFGPGQRLGRYELLQRLAVGGMAEVYLAYAKGPGDFRKVVAIKRLLPQHALDPQLLRMFLDEARLMARLSHPHIPQVTDVDDGAGGDVPYFVMEYVHGTDLRAVLNAADGPLPLEQALAITGAVAAGLHHAHEHRGPAGQRLEIVHRDISPSNILISFDGAVKITDFGVAKWSEQKSFTHQGQLKGKFAHMSPEQCRGEPLDRRSDVFALGTLLFEMTTGRPAFEADSEYELLTQIVSRDVSPPRRGGEIYPAQLEAIVMRSLRRDRDQRFPTAQHLQVELEAFAREHRLVVSPVALAAYVESLFGAQVTEWRAAASSGKTLADHLGSRPPPPRPERERTATDAFAVGAASRQPTAPAAPPGASAAAAPAAKLTGALTPRTVMITALTVAALALLLFATEVTSRWQRGAPTSPRVSSPRPNGERPPPFPESSGNPAAALPSAPRAAAQAGAPAAAQDERDTRAAAAGDTAAPPPGPRRGRDLARAGRRDRETGAAARAIGSSPSIAASTDAPGETVAATNSAGAASSPPGVARPQQPPASAAAVVPPRPAPAPAPVPVRPSVKVWDPDSPVPP